MRQNLNRSDLFHRWRAMIANAVDASPRWCPIVIAAGLIEGASPTFAGWFFVPPPLHTNNNARRPA